MIIFKNIYNKFILFYLALIAFTIIMFLINSKIGTAIGFGSFMISLGVYYGVLNNWRINKVDKKIYLICFFGFLSDVISFISLNKIFQFLQIFFSLSVLMLYISIFRIEGSYFVIKSTKKLPRILLIIFSVFFFVGYWLLETLPDEVYFLVLFYAFIEVVFMLLAIYRLTENKINYITVTTGVVLKFLGDAMFAIGFFVSQKNIFFILNIIFYSLSQLLLINGINQNITQLIISKKFTFKNRSILGIKSNSNFISIKFSS